MVARGSPGGCSTSAAATQSRPSTPGAGEDVLGPAGDVVGATAMHDTRRPDRPRSRIAGKPRGDRSNSSGPGSAVQDLHLDTEPARVSGAFDVDDVGAAGPGRARPRD